MPNLNPNLQQYIVQKFGLEGLNTYDDPSDLDDIELADVRNMIFDDGVLTPRQGSLLYIAKPSGETNDPFQLLIPTDSNGFEYTISVYANHFYLVDTTNPMTPTWIRLDQIYTPTTSGLFYGSTNWNNGRVDDRFYFGNGTDDTMKWIMALSHLSVAAASSDTTLTLVDSTSFPQSLFLGHPTISIGNPATISLPNTLTAGDTVIFSTTGALPAAITAGTVYYVLAAGLTATSFEISTSPGGSPIDTTADTQSGIHTVETTTIPIIVQNGATAVNLKYISNVANVLILASSGTVGANIPIGSTITMPIIDVPIIPHGKIFATDQTRFYTANGITNGIGSQNTFWWSYIDNPEDYTIDNTPGTAGFRNIHLGKGGIIGMNFFGQYLIVEKQNIMFQWIITLSSDLLSVDFSLEPIISGDDIGPVSNANSLSYMNTLYYPTTKQGIVSFSPNTTGSQTSSGLQVLSQKINNLVVDVLDFSQSRVCGLGQKLYWTLALPTVGISKNVNNLVLMFDLIRASENQTTSAWTAFDNWNAVDIKPVNDNLYYLSLNDGAIYQCNVPDIYQDAVENNPIPYTALALSKRFNLNSPANLFRGQYVYMEGYISLNTTFYVRVLDNENGSLGSQPYQISGTNSNIVSAIFSGGLGRFILASPVLGGVDLQTIQEFSKPLFFRCYLEVSQAFREHNLQMEMFSVDMGSFWGVTKMVLMTLPEPSIETRLVLSPTSAPMVSIQSL